MPTRLIQQLVAAPRAARSLAQDVRAVLRLAATAWHVMRGVYIVAVRFPGLHIDQRHEQIYFSLYFAMTGLHALHMIIGVGIFTVITFYAWKGKYTPEYHNPVEIAGLYWHFVDIVWIYLFPLLYLIDRKPLG